MEKNKCLDVHPRSPFIPDSDAKTRFLEIYILNVVTELFQTAIYSSLFRKNLVFSVASFLLSFPGKMSVFTFRADGNTGPIRLNLFDINIPEVVEFWPIGLVIEVEWHGPQGFFKLVTLVNDFILVEVNQSHRVLFISGQLAH